jgi:hypothetical protein
LLYALGGAHSQRAPEFFEDFTVEPGVSPGHGFNLGPAHPLS